MPEFIFILTEPAVPENIGFATRALKTMGFFNLRIVNGVNHQSALTRKTAYGSHDLLEAITIYQTLEKALLDIDLAIGTTSKKRIMRDEVLHVRELPEFIGGKGDSLKKVAIVFGSEESGLSNEQLTFCDVVSTIPLATKYPSLNLAQSVLIYAWEICDLSTKNNPIVESDGENALYGKFLEELDGVLLRMETNKAPAYHQKLRDRAQFMTEKDVKLVLSALRKIRRLIS